MTKIFKIKALLIFIIFNMLFIISGCKNNYTTMDNGFDVTVSSSLIPYMQYPEDAPKLHFDYDGVRVMIDAEGAAYFFVSNDQYQLSDKFSEHLNRYNDDQIIVISNQEQKRDKGYAKFGKDKLKLDEVDEFGNPQKYSREYQIVATDRDGTRYSYQYRTFVSDNKRYYIYEYTNNIGISIEQPIMVIKGENNKNKLLLLPLPYDTKYEVSGTALTVKSLTEKDTYINDDYYTFEYPKYIENEDEENKKNIIKEWYTRYCEGNEQQDGFYIKYAGAQYKVEFDVKKNNQLGFKLEFVK